MTDAEDVQIEETEGPRFRQAIIKVKTTWSLTGEITQTTTIAGIVNKRVLDIQERQVRDAMKAMGWLPPAFDAPPPMGRKQ